MVTSLRLSPPSSDLPGFSLERHWQRVTVVSVLLFPVSVVFRAMVALRRALYSAAIVKTRSLPVPVIVVGNITVGGTGKTPLVLWLAQFLAHHGLHPGIVSRGYGVDARVPRHVSGASEPFQSGDEPLLLARRSGSPVWIGVDRARAGEALLRAHPECDVILSDDGLQHYALHRDIEIALIDGARGFGNGFMLPAGPLREPASRLREVDAVVINGARTVDDPRKPALRMTLEGREFRNLLNPQHAVGPEHFQRRHVHAVAGIGNPERFFAHLQRLGLTFRAHAFPDHHRYTSADLAFAGADAVVMTEKDAIKCAAFATERHWALRVDAVPDPELGELVLRKLKALK